MQRSFKYFYCALKKKKKLTKPLKWLYLIFAFKNNPVIMLYLKNNGPKYLILNFTKAILSDGKDYFTFK